MKFFDTSISDSRISEIDLHGLSVQEAIEYTNDAIVEAIIRGDSELHIIVGKGLHSKGGVAKIRPAIEDLMDQYELVAVLDPYNVGVLLVRLDGGRKVSTSALSPPLRLTMPFYCQKCKKAFVTAGALASHKADSPMHCYCTQCDREFASWQARTAHYRDHAAHHYCDVCILHFADEDALDIHFEDEHLYCRVCNEFYDSQEDRDAEHDVQPHLYTRGLNTEVEYTDYARTHIPKAVHCPARGCDRAFALPGDLLQHLESGGCRGGVTRRAVDAAVVAYDRARVITNAARLTAGPSGALVPPQEPAAVWATVDAWNGSAFECCVCHRTFAALPRLNQHLASPAHAEELYRCPTAYGGCGAHFRTLSALVQHVEGAACGVARFKKAVHSVMDALTQDMRGLGI
ncbi:hypothetical protein PsYK624_062370 [Phanerochaete sordida]|uniref:C2H2-type domain-containing protein n=1 Tax=Phanerochaete sordida TaxID=48140 RepID=A0A9P3LD09_9APHY|nr:hypothetical protein PsYK624_062370 [Phanerochaete sordida]